MMEFFIYIGIYLLAGFIIIGFQAARDPDPGKISTGLYIMASIFWPLFAVFLAVDRIAVDDVTPFLRKVFGGPKQ